MKNSNLNLDLPLRSLQLPSSGEDVHQFYFTPSQGFKKHTDFNFQKQNVNNLSIHLNSPI